MGLVTAAVWTWAVSGSPPYSVIGYPSSGETKTKTGLGATDLKNYVGVPLQYFNTKPPTAVPDSTIIQWIRWAEDYIESRTGLLLTQSWVASPPAVTPAQAQAVGFQPTSSGGYQIQGVDYDIEDAAYDFFYERARDEGWMNLSLRFKPVKDITYGPWSPTAIKQISYVYPLLNQFFQVPLAWEVEDHDFGLVRLVPSANVQMLPLFAMQLAFMGFAESVPGAIWMQYRAGLTQNDYRSRWSFIPQLVLAQASGIALQAIQGTINMGAEEYKIFVDGLQYATRFSKNGPFGFLIDRFEKQRDDLIAQALSKVAGPVLSML